MTILGKIGSAADQKVEPVVQPVIVAQTHQIAQPPVVIAQTAPQPIQQVPPMVVTQMQQPPVTVTQTPPNNTVAVKINDNMLDPSEVWILNCVLRQFIRLK